MFNLYNYKIKQPNGQYKSFKGIPNNESKEINLIKTKQLFISGNLDGIITAQNNPNEKYIFINGVEQRNNYLFELKTSFNELENLINDALKQSQNINLNIDAYKSLKKLNELNEIIQFKTNEFLNDLNKFVRSKNLLDIKPSYNFDKRR